MTAHSCARVQYQHALQGERKLASSVAAGSILYDGQALAAPESAPPKHIAAAGRSHALQKSVFPLPRDTLWLKGPFWQSEAPDRAVTGEIIGSKGCQFKTLLFQMTRISSRHAWWTS